MTLHSYRYAWAGRAKSAGYPPRFAMEALGHNSKAVHHAYARKSELRLPSLEDYESAKADGKILVFEPQAHGFAKPAGDPQAPAQGDVAHA